MVELPSKYCAKHKEHEVEYKPRDANSVHRYNTVTRNRNESKTNQYAFYRTRQWVHLRQQALERDYYLCAYCKLSNIVTPAKTADHTVPVEVDANRKTDLDNLHVICSSCHTKKTRFEQTYYGTGEGNVLKNVRKIDDIELINKLMNRYSV